ncbi:MAG: single-stranded DNA-binding protein [Acidobacteria bacterium]|nr:single-stranded DNA-binding protein [Acidobacteriota bacterium]
MPRSVNKVILLGHLGKDADTRFTTAGTAVTNFSLATSRRFKDPQTGEWKDETDWHNVVIWKAENVSNYLTKGRQVYVEGRLRTRSYDDKDGNKRYVTEVVADELILVGGRGEGGGSEAGEGGGYGGGYEQPRGPVSMPRSARPQPASRPQPVSEPEPDFGGHGVSDDDVPF